MHLPGEFWRGILLAGDAIEIHYLPGPRLRVFGLETRWKLATCMQAKRRKLCVSTVHGFLLQCAIVTGELDSHHLCLRVHICYLRNIPPTGGRRQALDDCAYSPSFAHRIPWWCWGWFVSTGGLRHIEVAWACASPMAKRK